MRKVKRSMPRPISAPAVKSYSFKTNAPAMRSGRDGSITVTHRELVTLLQAPGGSRFQGSYYINPGLTVSFPWLSSIARRYESYTVERFAVEFVPWVATSTNGRFMHTIDYDPNDSPGSYIQAAQSQNSIGGSLWAKSTCSFNKSSMKTTTARKLVRYDTEVSSELTLYDVGLYTFYVEGISQNAGTTLGELHFVYSIKFFIPQLLTPSAALQSGATSVFYANPGTNLPPSVSTNVFENKVQETPINQAGIIFNETNSEFKVTQAGTYGVDVQTQIYQGGQEGHVEYSILKNDTVIEVSQEGIRDATANTPLTYWSGVVQNVTDADVNDLFTVFASVYGQDGKSAATTEQGMKASFRLLSRFASFAASTGPTKGSLSEIAGFRKFRTIHDGKQLVRITSPEHIAIVENNILSKRAPATGISTTPEMSLIPKVAPPEASSGFFSAKRL